MGPQSPTPFVTFFKVDRFPFSTPFTTATDVGDLQRPTEVHAGLSSEEDGYLAGGNAGNNNPLFPPLPAPEVGTLANISTFPFSTPFTTTTDVGFLIEANFRMATHQD